ncbi:hypothetical protein BCR36DRAFT_328103 [Piromyces finnis]|uniref:Crinkler effector protein N-terminal domain-containing protein n=1 Tax=Piromyces finnis TaxID=1754191 RepID=A0A1Y1V978_9FUNG|nr:hypothetical protein BCR36DRAFT_328103 [Piromyces finnis]|eukprot:ORX49733.1 hypothetical protein BCR36DRAFT_328103 [Piromyces finnis]
MLNITCLLWGDDPSQGFMVNVSPKDTIYNLKQKIIEHLDFESHVYRKMKIIKLKEFITLDDERLKKSSNPKDLFDSVDLDKPFQILDEYFSSKDENLKEFPLDVIVIINNNIPVAILDNKEKETEVMAPHKPVSAVVRESAIVTNNPNTLLNKNEIIIDPSLFPSPPSFENEESTSEKIKKISKGNSHSNISNVDISSDIIPRTKSLIFNIDRFPSPPNDTNDDNINNTDVNNCNNLNRSVELKNKYIVHDINQFPNAPANEYIPSVSKVLSTTTEEDIPPSYDAISNKRQNILPNNNTYNSNINNNSFSQFPNQNKLIKRDKKSITLQKSVLICSCLCIGVMVSTFLAVIIGKILLDKGKEGPQQMKKIPYVIGNIKSIDDRQGKTTSTIIFATTTVNRPFPTYIIDANEVKDIPEKEIISRVFFKDPENTEVLWKIKKDNDLAMGVEIKKLENHNKKRDYYYDYKRSQLNKYLIENNNIENNYANRMINNERNYFNTFNNNNFNFNNYNNDFRNNPYSKKDNVYNNNEFEIGPYEGEPNNINSNKPNYLVKDIIGKNDFSLKLFFKIKRIIEIGFNETNFEVLNYLDLNNENEAEKPIVVDNSQNVSGGIVEIKRLFRQMDSNGNIDKEVEVFQKLYTCSSKCGMRQKDEFNLDVDPTKYRLNFMVKKWNIKSQKDAKLQVLIDVDSSKMYWSDVSSNTINFDKGQVTLVYGDKGSLEGGKDIFTDRQNSTIKMDLVLGPFFDKHVDKNDIHASLSLNVEMTNYKILQSIASSSSLSFNANSYYLWFFTLFFIIIYNLIV